MAEAVTRPTDVPVGVFLATVANAQRRADAEELLAIMADVTGAPGVMWGPSIVGFGTMTMTYASGRTGEWPRVAFSPRSASLVLYGLTDHPDAPILLAELGPHTSSVACVYLKRLDDVDEGVLRALIAQAWSLY